MINGTSTALNREVEFKENGSVVHLTADIPSDEREQGRIHEAHTNSGGWMETLDDKGSKEITLRQSTLWFAATALVLMQVAFSYGGSLLGWAREDQSQKAALISLARDLERIVDSQARQEQKYDRLDERLRESERFIDRVGGYGAADREKAINKESK